MIYEEVDQEPNEVQEEEEGPASLHKGRHGCNVVAVENALQTKRTSKKRTLPFLMARMNSVMAMTMAVQA